MAVTKRRFKEFVVPMVFLSALLLSLLFCSNIPYSVKSVLYALSVSIKECLVFSLPFVIFALVFSSIVKLGYKAMKYILIIVPLVCCSNFINTMMAYLISFQTTEYCGRVSAVQAVVADVLEPCFSFSLPRIVSNDVVLVLGALSSLVLFFTVNRAAMAVSGILERFTRVYFRILVPMMPIFIIGTALKLQSEGVLSQMFKQYLPILLVFMLSACIWIFLQFLTACNFKFQRLSSCLGSIVPAVTTAFSTASSASALPLSIKAAEKNTSNNSAGIIVPSSVNIHLVGDCFFIPMIAIAIMNSFGQELPGIVIYSLFAVHFVLAKFAVAAIPGGGIIVMLPILQDYLGFAADMQAVAMALYMLFDPLITACNVGGNCALAIFFDKIVGLFEKPSGKPGGKPNATSGKNYRKSGKNNEGR